MTLGHILELLTFCVEHHTYHIKNYVISKDLLRRVLVLMKSQHKFLVLSKFAMFLFLFCVCSEAFICTVIFALCYFIVLTYKLQWLSCFIIDYN